MKIDIRINNQTMVVIMFCFFIIGAILVMSPEGIIQINNYKDCTYEKSKFEPIYFEHWAFATPEEIINNTTECYSSNQCAYKQTLKGCNYDGCNWCCNNKCTLMYCNGKTRNVINYSNIYIKND